MEDAHEGTDEVIGFGVGAEIAAGDGAPNGSHEGGVDERARAFDNAHGAAGNGVHGRDNESFGGHVVDEEKHPGAKRFKRRHGGSEALFSCRKLFDFAAVDGFDEVVASWEVAIEGGVANARSACDVVEARSCSIAGFFGHAVMQDMPASSEWTRKTLGWEPTGPRLIEDLTNMKYF